MVKNPHNWTTCIQEVPRPENRIWRCNYCKMEDTYDALHDKACTYKYPPCKSCGQTPECAPDCSGIAEALSDEGVYLVGFPEKPS